VAPLTRRQIRWARRWMTIVVIGFFIFIIGVQPDILGLNRSLTVGFVQIGVWLFGLAIHVVRNGKPTSLRADIGLRLIATGYVVAMVASLADFIGVGAQRMPFITFGPVQVIGLVTGVLLSLLGVVLYWPRQKKTKESDPEDEEGVADILAAEG
jgi:uncharacterized membrane protein